MSYNNSGRGGGRGRGNSSNNSQSVVRNPFSSHEPLHQRQQQQENHQQQRSPQRNIHQQREQSSNDPRQQQTGFGQRMSQNNFVSQQSNSSQKSAQPSRNPFGLNGSTGFTSSSRLGMQQPQVQQAIETKFYQRPEPQTFGHSSMRDDSKHEQQRFSSRQGNSNFVQHNPTGRGNQQPAQLHVARNPFQSQQEQQQQQGAFSEQRGGMQTSNGYPASNMHMNMSTKIGLGGENQQNNRFSGFDSSKTNSLSGSQFQSFGTGFNGRFQSDQAVGFNSAAKSNAFQQQGQLPPQFHPLNSDSLREVDASAAIVGAITADFSLGLPLSSTSAYSGGGNANQGSAIAGASIDIAASSSATASEGVVKSVFTLLSETPPAYCPYEDDEPLRAGFISNIPPPPAAFNPTPFSRGQGFGVSIR